MRYQWGTSGVPVRYVSTSVYLPVEMELEVEPIASVCRGLAAPLSAAPPAARAGDARGALREPPRASASSSAAAAAAAAAASELEEARAGYAKAVQRCHTLQVRTRRRRSL